MDRPRSRRGFLDVVLRVTGVAWLASVAYPVVRYLSPLPRSSSGGLTTLTPEETGRMKEAGFIIVRAGPTKVIVFRDHADRLRALDAKCTHEGCLVRYLRQQSVISCACHNASFDLDGRVLDGPPPRPLATHKVQEDAEGNVVVATGAS